MGPLHVVLVSALACATPSDNVLYDFSATWCGPCQQMTPVVSKLEREGLPICKVDVDQNRALAQKYRVGSIPAFVLVINGKMVDHQVGMQSENQLRQMIARIPVSRPAKGTDLAKVNRSDLTAPKPQPKTPNKEPVVRGNNPAQEPNTRVDADFLKVTARIHVQDPEGANVGTGTIIESRPGMTLVLTCGHIFRNINKAKGIDVELFVNGRAEKFQGKYLAHDDKADIGLLTIATPEAMPTARVAPLSYAVATGEAVVSVGCGGGSDPTIERVQVTALNRYLGPDNLECTGVPQQGRSGGGLFTTTGLVVGVCTAADPRDKKGLYCALKPIHTLLASSRPTTVDPAPALGGKTLPEAELPQVPTEAELLVTDEDLIPAEVQAFRDTAPTENQIAAEQALAGAQDAEIVCVIRPIGKPQAASKVVVIHRATPDFVSQLTGELENQPEMNRTSLRKPAPAKAPARRPVVTAKANTSRSLSVKPVADGKPRPFRLAK